MGRGASCGRAWIFRLSQHTPVPCLICEGKETEESLEMKKQTVGNIVITLVGILLSGSGAAKLAHIPKVDMQMAAMGFGGNKLLFIALLELASAALFLLPLTRSAGLLLVSSYLGGAIATHVQHDQPILVPSILLLVIWLGVWLRHREASWSFGSLKEATVPGVNAAIRAREI
jgi:hypothetical protein